MPRNRQGARPRFAVQVVRADAVGSQVSSAEPIFLGDAIASGSLSGMQIILMDGSVFTIGPESALEIDAFVYNPAQRVGRLAASMTKGVMRFVTGKIAAGEPKNMTIRIPVGTIGIRGTVGIVQVLTPEEAAARFPAESGRLFSGDGGQAGVPVVFAALVGPGPNNNAGTGVGSFNLTTPDGSVDLNRIGASVLAAPGAPPVFFIAPPAVVQSAGDTLAVQPEEGEDDAAAGEDGDGTGDNSGDGGQGGGGLQAASGASGQASGEALTSAVTLSDLLVSAEDGAAPVNAVAVTDPVDIGVPFDDLRAISGGLISANGTSVAGEGFAYDFSSVVSFGARTWQVQFTQINGNGASNGTVETDGSLDYSGLAGNATVSTSNGLLTANCDCTAQVSITSISEFNGELSTLLTVGSSHSTTFSMN